jgi:hypothetical protein
MIIYIILKRDPLPPILLEMRDEEVSHSEISREIIIDGRSTRCERIVSRCEDRPSKAIFIRGEVAAGSLLRVSPHR